MAVTDYYLLDYIESSGNQYIDTGLVLTDNSTVDIKVYFSGTGLSMFGSFQGNAPWTHLVYDLSLYYGSTHVGKIFNAGVIYNFKSVTTSSKTYSYTLNGVTTNGSYSGAIAPYTYKLFASGSSGDYRGSGKIYYCKLTDSGLLKRNMVAAKRKTDNVLGMYDLVENKFYTNAGSGSFTAGSMSASSVNVNINNTLWGTTSSTSGYKYVDGSVTVTLTATPKTGCTFSGWYDTNNNLVSNLMRYEYTGPVDSGLTAVFSVPHIYLKLNGYWKDIV